MARWSTVLSGVFLALSMVLSLGKLLMLAANGKHGELTEADQWLAENMLSQYIPLFQKMDEIESYGQVFYVHWSDGKNMDIKEVIVKIPSLLRWHLCTHKRFGCAPAFISQAINLTPYKVSSTMIR